MPMSVPTIVAPMALLKRVTALQMMVGVGFPINPLHPILIDT